jgi:uncharacterized protein YkwD
VRVSLLLLLTLSCAVPPGTAPAPPPPSAPPAAGGYAQLADDVIAVSNRARGDAGLRPFVTDPALNRAATDYAIELAARRTLDHSSPTPGRETMTRRIEAAGGSWQRAAENLASRTGPAGDVAAGSVGGWLRSTGHRANLLDAAFTHTGAGVARDAQGMWYIVQLYTLPRRQ